MNEERMKILNMVSEGKITAEEADKLLAKLAEQEKPFSSGAVSSPAPNGALPKYLLVQVDPKEGTNSDHGKVRVRVPLSLVRAGINIAALMPKEVHEKVDNAMHEKGMNFNLSNLDMENIDEILIALKELVVDVESESETVKVYCE